MALTSRPAPKGQCAANNITFRDGETDRRHRDGQGNRAQEVMHPREASIGIGLGRVTPTIWSAAKV